MDDDDDIVAQIILQILQIIVLESQQFIFYSTDCQIIWRGALCAMHLLHGLIGYVFLPLLLLALRDVIDVLRARQLLQINYGASAKVQSRIKSIRVNGSHIIL